jgi:hypothetical protein
VAMSPAADAALTRVLARFGDLLGGSRRPGGGGRAPLAADSRHA